MRGVTRDRVHVETEIIFQPALPMRGVTKILLHRL